MQKTEIVETERPRRAMQVVPLEPGLLYGRRSLVVGVFVFVLSIVNLCFVFNTELANESLFDTVALCYIILTALSLFSLPRWRALNKRRQQATRYNLAVILPTRAFGQPQADLPALPDRFAISTHPRQFRILILVISLVFALIVTGAFIYSYGQDMLQAVQHGVPMTLVALEIALNIAILPFLIADFFMLYTLALRQQLIATREGLICRWGYHITSIPWQQARLFAIIGQGNRDSGPAFYELASETALIRWSSHASSRPARRTPTAVMFANNSYVEPDPSAAELPQQVQCLNIIIAERTGLPLYDLR